MRGVQMPSRLLAIILITSFIFFPSSAKATDSQPPQTSSAQTGSDTLGAFTRKSVDGRVVCLEASVEQSRAIKGRNQLPLIVLTPDPSPAPRTGLKIILRGTSQLQSSPSAIEAFKRAAARWEPQIRTVVTIVIDVDYGPTLFGRQFDDGAVSVTDAQVLGGNSLYPAVRADLISGPYSPDKRSFYGSLPPENVPADAGASAGLVATSATLRALDLIAPTADPDGESSDFGPPPSIGFNSGFSFDFDLSDGIDPNKLDFEAMAQHEIGHVLGFISAVGQQEMNPSTEIAPSICDLFRVRPEVTDGDLAVARRVLSSGGEQRFFARGEKIALSTGRPDGTGGDLRHPAHWKDDDLTGQYLGVMDPTLKPGEHQFITDEDISVLDAIGYRTRSLLDPTTVVSLIPAQSQTGGLFAPLPGLGVLGHVHYSVAAPPGATELRIDLNGNQDVDLYARFGRPVANQGHIPIWDYRARSESNSETLIITPSSSPPLGPGLYYIAVANFGPGDANYTVTATVSGGDFSRAPAIFNTESILRGDALEIDCSARDRDGDFAMAEVRLLDGQGSAIRPSMNFAIDSGTATRIQSRFVIEGLNSLPRAQRASILLTDRAGNRSAASTVDFSKPDVGGLNLIEASFDASKLKLKMQGRAEGLELEINGRVIAPPLRIKVNGSGTKASVKGDQARLALQSGPNRIRMKNLNGWSNILILGIP